MSDVTVRIAGGSSELRLRVRDRLLEELRESEARDRMTCECVEDSGPVTLTIHFQGSAISIPTNALQDPVALCRTILAKLGTLIPIGYTTSQRRQIEDRLRSLGYL